MQNSDPESMIVYKGSDVKHSWEQDKNKKVEVCGYLKHDWNSTSELPKLNLSFFLSTS